MLKSLVARGFLMATLLAAAAPAQAGWIHGRPVLGDPCRTGCLPLGFITGGSHLGLGPGYPGLYPPWPRLWPYNYVPGAPPPPPTVVVIPVTIPADVPDHGAARGDETVQARPGFNYRETVERARRLYPRGIPPIEPLPGSSPR
jgi:hypothetical protein